jgi:hypothetical protein
MSQTAPKTRLAVCFALLVASFLLLNRGAYRGYFQDDDLDTLSWAPRMPAVQFFKAAMSPFFQPDNFRPAGHLFYHAAEALFGLNFPLWVASIQAIHLFNAWLLWLLARRMGATRMAAGAGCLLFALHMALFDAVWKPMYIFDVLCAGLCLLSLLLYSQRRWILSFLAFWLAYKAKELAVMLPVALAAYEFWFKKRNPLRAWRPLLPFFAASLSFGMQGILLNPNHDNDYTFRFTPEALEKTALYYAGRIFLTPYLGFALPLAAVFAWRTPGARRVWFGLAMTVLFFLPLLFLPGRIFSAYCYLPLAGVTLMLTGLFDSLHPAAIACFFLLWAPQEIHTLRAESRPELAKDAQIREWVAGVAGFTETHPQLDAAVYAGRITGFAPWGYAGAIHYLLKMPDLPIRYIDDPGAKELLGRERVALFTWNETAHRLAVHARGADASYIQVDGSEPVWQLEDGWYTLEGNYRWIAPSAAVRLRRPAGARRLVLRVNAGPGLLHDVGPVTVRLALNGVDLEPRTFRQPGWQTAEWPLDPAPAGPAQIAIRTTPPYRPPADARVLGIAVGAVGFQ